MNRAEIEKRVAELGPWLHNIELDGVMTAPTHFLDDNPRQKWKRFAHAVPLDLTGKSVLDVGCNAGFYSLEMKRRGARRVVAIDRSDFYLEQARFASRVTGVDIEIRKLDVYAVGELGATFDVVLFMGVLDHLRHPLLALDLLREHVVGETLVFQSVQSDHRASDVPQMHFVEHRAANTWVPNRSCVEAMLRSAGFTIETQPEGEVYVCKVDRPNR